MDTLKQYLALRQTLEREKKALLSRVAEIDKVLGGTGSVGRPAGAAGAKGLRPRNRISLREAVIKVTKDRPLTKPEILDEIAKLGYQFVAKNPVNSLNTVLYTRKQFKNSDGRFSPAK